MTAFVLFALLAVAAPLPKEADETFEKGVATTREKAIDFLKKQQTKDGHWEGIVIDFLAGMEGGTTALATLGLLEAGVKPDDAAIVKAVKYLVKLEPQKTYVVSLQTQVLARIDAKTHAKQIQTNVDWLLDKVRTNEDGKINGWSYPENQIADNSNTHFAVVALHAAAKAGAKIDAKVWRQIREYYTRSFKKDGWSYYNGRADFNWSISMTGCGLLGLAICAKHDTEAKEPLPEFTKGMAAYLDKWTITSTKSTFYNMMAISELGRVLDVKEFKSGNVVKAWYREGANKLVKMQNEDGSFSQGKSVDGYPLLATAMGLYFLGPPEKKK